MAKTKKNSLEITFHRVHFSKIPHSETGSSPKRKGGEWVAEGAPNMPQGGAHFTRLSTTHFYLSPLSHALEPHRLLFESLLISLAIQRIFKRRAKNLQKVLLKTVKIALE